MEQVTEEAKRSTIKDGLATFWKFLNDKRTILLLPAILVQGIHQSFSFGNYPLFISNSSDSATSGSLHIAISFLLYSIGLFIGSFTWGKFFDYCEKRLPYLIVFHFNFVSIAFPLLIATVLTNINNPLAVIYAVGILFGLNDSLLNAIVNQTTSTIYTESELPLAFSWYWCVFCVGYSVVALLSGYLAPPQAYSDPSTTGITKMGWLIVPIVNIVFMCISFMSGCVLDAQVIRKAKVQIHPLNSGSNQEKDQEKDESKQIDGKSITTSISTSDVPN